MSDKELSHPVVFEAGDIIRATAENLDAVGRWVARFPGATRIRAGVVEGTLTTIPMPIFNTVVGPQFTPENVDEGIATFTAAARERNIPMLWHLTPGSTPHDLGEHLERAGFHKDEDAPSMALTLSQMVMEEMPTGVTVARATPADRDALVDIWIRGFVMPAWLEEPLHRLLEYDAAGGFEDFIASLDGIPVAGGSVFYGGGVAGIYNVATLESARGRGIGGAVTRAALLDARDRGYRVGVLQSSPLGLSVYRRLGFTHVCDIGIYVFAPS